MSHETDLRLLIDMGNTRVKWVWAQGGVIIESSFGRGGPDDFRQRCLSPDGGTPSGVLLSSVASQAATRSVATICADTLGVPVRKLKSRSSTAGIVNGYERPSDLGVDRWLAIVGAAHEYGMPVVVMDLGTATTLDAVDQRGRHLGGLILPGPALMLDALGRATSMQVPADFKSESAQGRKPGGVGVGPAEFTSAAITGGVRAAQIGALNQFMRHVAERLRTEPKLVLTGGASEGIMERLQDAAVFDPWLVFRGMLKAEK